MKIKTVTPVHVGTGETYGPLDFFIKGGLLHRVDFLKFLSSLDENGRNQVIKLINEERYREIQRLFGEEHTIYTAQLRSGVIPKRIRDVRVSFKTLSGEPYIPGSSIKGSLRSGLYLYYTLPEHAREGERITGVNTLEGLRGVRGRNRIQKTAEEMEKRFFHTGRGKFHDAKFDLFRFVHVSDFMPENATVHIDQVITYSQQRDGSMKPKHFLIHAETAEGTFTGEIKLNLEALIKAMDSQEYPLLQRKLAMFGLSRDDLFSDNVQQRFVTNLVKRATESRDIAYLHDLDLMANIEGATDVAGFLMKNLPSAEGFLRLGFGVGTHFQGIIKAIEKEDPRFAVDLINKFRDTRKKNPPPIRRLVNNNVVPPYPKTIELTSEYKPLGWMKVVIE